MVNQTKSKRKKSYLIALAAALMIGVLATGLALAGDDAKPTPAPVYWTWGAPAMGSSRLVRTASGVNASLDVGGLRPGNAVTGWIIVFNYPDECLEGCGPADIFRPGYPPGEGPAKPDFFPISGQVIGESGRGHFAGTLRVDDIGHSGLAELKCPDTMDCTAGLMNPEGALIVLATHDHGPAQTGLTLKAQLSSFLGGCSFKADGSPDFNGDEYGMATGPGDIPDDVGECSTIQMSPHAP